MHTIEEIRAEYDRLDRLCGVDSSGVEIVISNRGVRRLGSFRQPAPGSSVKPRITISASILGEEEQFWDTVRHEYAHAAVYLLRPGERHGHDELWKAVCRKVGCRPRSRAPESAERRAQREAQAKYVVTCPGCGAAYYYYRAGDVVKLLRSGRGGRLRCPKCGGRDLILTEQGK